ncbi:MAG: 3-deoxy-7-phosphoheptulonate synthase [Deltaproteobacteria bacterium]|nr:3-deoxy-7-phosphoheptulonate synthase [Deltaproteobacteria bacterium]
MIVLVDPEQAYAVQRALVALGAWTTLERDASGAALIVLPHSARLERQRILELRGVLSVLEAPSAHPKLDGQRGQELRVRDVVIGRGQPVLIAGPCAIESPEQIEEAAMLAAAAGARILRGGAWKPRTSPYSFQGRGREALEWMRHAATKFGLGVVTEVVSEGDVELVAEQADILQIGSRSMQSFALLRAVGSANKPVLLKRSASARLDEWRLAAEHLLVSGASAVIFCERGIVGFDASTRNLLDLTAVAVLKHVDGHLVMVDPSHAAGRRDLVLPLAKAALAAGADGIIVESHPDPANARSDGPQALDPQGLRTLGVELGFAPELPANDGE